MMLGDCERADNDCENCPFAHECFGNEEAEGYDDADEQGGAGH